MSHKTGNSGLSGVSGFSGKPEPAESAVPCSLLRQGLKFARGGAGTNHRSHHYLGCHAVAGNVRGAKFCFPHELTELLLITPVQEAY